MHAPLTCSIDKKKSNKLTIIMMLLFCSLPLAINSICLVPLYASLQSNVAFESSALVVIIKYFQDFLDLVAFAVSYALIIFSILLISKKNARLAVLIYTLSFLLRIPVRLLMNVALYGTLGTSTQITVDLIYLFVYFLLEMLQLLIVYIFAVTDSKKYLYHLELQHPNKKEKKKGKTTTTQGAVLPFAKFFDWYNPLQRTAIKMSLLIFLMKIIARILNDISFGMPESFGEVIIMVIYYLSDILYGVIAYIVALIVFNSLYDRLKIKKTDEDSSPSVL